MARASGVITLKSGSASLCDGSGNPTANNTVTVQYNDTVILKATAAGDIIITFDVEDEEENTLDLGENQITVATGSAGTSYDFIPTEKGLYGFTVTADGNAEVSINGEAVNLYYYREIDSYITFALKFTTTADTDVNCTVTVRKLQKVSVGQSTVTLDDTHSCVCIFTAAEDGTYTFTPASGFTLTDANTNSAVSNQDLKAGDTYVFICSTTNTAATQTTINITKTAA